MTIFNGTSGNDTFAGGSGADTFNLYGGNDYATGAGGGDTLYGGTGNDNLFGGPELAGAGGSDFIFGGDGDDIMSGLDANDTLDGGGGSDELSGGPGADVLDGAGGDVDFLYGEDGADTFRWDSNGVGEYAHCGGTDGDRDTVIGSNVADLQVDGFYETTGAAGDRVDWLRSGASMDTDGDGLVEISDSVFLVFTITADGSGGLSFVNDATGADMDVLGVNNQMFASQIT